jgi:hypothetical protein
MVILFLVQLVFAQANSRTLIEDIAIEGQVQKPEIFLSLRRGDTSKAYELELRESFIPKILETMKKEPL